MDLIYKFKHGINVRKCDESVSKKKLMGILQDYLHLLFLKFFLKNDLNIPIEYSVQLHEFRIV